MAKKPPEPKIPKGITPYMVTKDGAQVQATSADGEPVYRVRFWDPVLRRQIERKVAGLDVAKTTLDELKAGKRRPGRTDPEKITFFDASLRYMEAYKTKRDGTPRPRPSVRKEITYLNSYLLPVLGNAWIGDLDLPDLNDCIKAMTLKNGEPASPATKGGAASVLRRVFTWAREERLITSNPSLELRTGWGAPTRRRVLIPSIPQVVRLAEALDHFKPGLGDVARVIAFTGLRWEEIVAVLANDVDQEGQLLPVVRTASESGGRRDVREGTKSDAGNRAVVIPDIAMPAVTRLLQRGVQGRELSGGTLYVRLVNGDRGGYLSYAIWRRYLALARGFTAAHPDGAVTYTAHELRHVCASLLIASGASDMQICNQMGHSRVETTKNIYGHLFEQDRAALLDAMNSAITRLYIADDSDGEGGSLQPA